MTDSATNTIKLMVDGCQIATTIGLLFYMVLYLPKPKLEDGKLGEASYHLIRAGAVGIISGSIFWLCSLVAIMPSTMQFDFLAALKK